ncbi:hypothetical protein NEF87_003222 [Candidatus Lokiarchaeum ossiferum]|uniref:AN1-type domain-containing protein n=1 Tax=Candidatus Lokiarchaeum ossiferum TaxID=2951803 RepID=A0ABY6HTT3_9ARCH|nr:hypothetical protein NEF87_003222 [Candidatus Lokiarchaeum sp. B-35]
MAKKCQFCGKDLEIIPFKCNYCKLEYCTEHRLPEKHECFGNFKRNVVSLSEKRHNSPRKEQKRLYQNEFGISNQYTTFNRRELIIPLIIAFLINPLMDLAASGFFLCITRFYPVFILNPIFSNLIQIISQIFSLIIILLVTKPVFSIKFRNEEEFTPKTLGNSLKFFLSMIFIATFLLSNPISSNNIETDPQSTSLILDFLSAVILAPIMEELIYRGMLIPSLKQNGLRNTGAAFYSGFAFA